MTTLSPKARFIALQSSSPSIPPPADVWSSFMVSETAQVALEAAFNNFALNLKAGDAPAAAQSYYKLEGAREFMKQLLSIGLITKEIDAPQMRPLHNV